jgi:pyrophosphatase PpaX
MKSRSVKALIFDMDGTLLDSETVSGYAVNYGYRKILGREITPEERKQLLGRPVKKILSQWYPEKGGEIYDTGRRYYESNFSSIAPYRGITDVLAKLRKQCRLAVVTSSHRSDAEKLLSMTGLKRYFEFYIGQEDSDHQKPDPEPVILATVKLGIESREAMFIGDQPYDILAAQAAGVISVAAVWGSGDEGVLKKYNPNFILRRPDELVSLFESYVG